MEKIIWKDNQKNKRYFFFKQENQYYYIDLYRNKWITVFPFLIYFINYDIYKISIKDIENIENNTHNNISTFIIISLSFIIGKIISKINFYTSSWMSLLLIIIGFLLGIILGISIFKKNQNVVFDDAKKTEKKIKFNINVWWTVISLIILLIGYYMIISYLLSSFKSQSINFISIIIFGIVYVILWAIPYKLCMNSKFKVIKKGDMR